MKGLSGSRIRKASNMGFLLVFSGGGKWLVNAVSSLSPEWIGSVGLPFSSPSSSSSSWVHPADKRAAALDSGMLIKMAKMDAIASMSSPCPTPRGFLSPKKKPDDHRKYSMGYSSSPSSKLHGTAKRSKTRDESGMLFIECEVEGAPVRTFVDTGAQVTVMSKECAERRGLMSELDTRFAGKAVGVGSTRILGRINDAHIKIGQTYLTCALTVIDHANVDLLVGLDVLRKYQCDISLERNSMTFNHAGVRREVAFLSRIEDAFTSYVD